jgi:hypothetical protein
MFIKAMAEKVRFFAKHDKFYVWLLVCASWPWMESCDAGQK